MRVEADHSIGDNIVALADLRTESSDVSNTFNSWINNLVSTYSSTQPFAVT